MIVLALSILPCLVIFLYRRPLLLLYMWPVFILISAIFVDANVEVEGYARLPFVFLPMDVVYFFTITHLVLYAVLQPNRFVALLKENPFLSILLAIVFLYVLIYTPLHGKAALGEGRKFYFMFLFPLLALVSIKTSEDLRRLMIVVVLCAAFLAAIGVIQGVMSRSIVRVLTATQTLIIAFAMFSVVIHRLYNVVMITPWLDKILLLLFSFVVMWSGHRSVWLAVGFGGVLMLSVYRRRSTTVVKASLLAIGAILAMLIAIAVFPKAGEQITRGFEGILNPTADHTASWRIEGWRQQVDELLRDGRLLFGKGLGSYFRWEFDGQKLKVAPHNAYIETLAKLGLLGLTVYGLLVFHFVRNVLAVRRRLAPGVMKAYIEIGLLNFAAAHAYFLGYGFDPIVPVFLALALVASKLARRPLEYQRWEHLGKLRMYRGRSLPLRLATPPPSVSA